MKLIVIIGITGQQGGSVADTFLNDKTWHIRAITRDPSRPSAQQWATRGVSLARGDVDDIASLTSAFTGAHAVFAMTDFWAPLADSAVHAEAAHRGISPSQRCAEIEVQRGVNIARAAASPVVRRTLERLVYSSLPFYSQLSGGRYTQVWHCDSKAAVEQYMRGDAVLGPLSSFIYMGVYADNWRRVPLDIQRDAVSGGYWHVCIDDGRSAVPIVWTRRDTGPLVKKLVEDVRPGVRLLGCSQMISRREIMATVSRVLGVKLAGDEGIKRVSDNEYKAMVNGGEAHREHVLQIWQMLRDFGYDGGDRDTVCPADIGAEGLTTSFEEYVKWEDWAKLLTR
ncbi:hypothetical protein E8E13_010729 [Curvularia kusanoi]|uniref:NmrA-like domain-containing protein n=1 Tax=Curvularia kusanoi TaxID=90978 RepID=A0A9P4WBM8_CURKU|nr:hypothetical protein E8E13_010729 [Curvularia kusanoi]